MKKIIILSFLLSLHALFSGFVGPIQYNGEFIPIFMKRADLENSVTYREQKQPMVNPGKIYYKAPYIYVNERYKGVHIIDNSNPANPVKKGFITAPGCMDMAVKEDIMYLDNSVDLVAFNLSEKKVMKRIKNVFPEPSAPDYSYNYYSRDEDMIIVEWKNLKEN